MWRTIWRTHVIKRNVRALSDGQLGSELESKAIQYGKLLGNKNAREKLKVKTTIRWVKILFPLPRKVVRLKPGIYVTDTSMGIGLSLKFFPMALSIALSRDLQYRLEDGRLGRKKAEAALIKLIKLLEL